MMDVSLEAATVSSVPPRLTVGVGFAKPPPVITICVPAVFSVTLEISGEKNKEVKTGSSDLSGAGTAVLCVVTT